MKSFNEYKLVVSEWLESFMGIPPGLQWKLWASLVIIIFLWLIRTLTMRLLHRRVKDVRSLYRWRKHTLHVVVAFGVLLIGRIWFPVFENITTFIGIVSAGLAIALRDLLVNLAGWIFIVWRRPFEVGDRIEVVDRAGDVIDQRIFMFTLMEIRNWVGSDQSTGRVIHMPNGVIFREPLANFSKGFAYIWDEIPVLVTFESNWKKAKEILLRIAEKHSMHLSEKAQRRVREAARKFMIFYSKLTPTVYTSVSDSGVLLTIRYLCPPRRRRGSQQQIWEDILEEFAQCPDIDFAYPTQRFYNNMREGKPEAKARPEEGPGPGAG
jgi:small-conductance mechanosensitive channel